VKPLEPAFGQLSGESAAPNASIKATKHEWYCGSQYRWQDGGFMSIQRYFDLRQPATFRDPKPKASSSETHSRSLDTNQELSVKWQIVTYGVLVLSIMASRFLDLFRAGVASSFRIDLPYLIFIATASLLVFPVVYDKACFNRDKPLLLQIGVIFSAGMGWEKIVSTAVGK